MHHFKLCLLRLLRDRGNIFWSLAFPIILGTLFYAAFGNLGVDTFSDIHVAVVVSNDNENFEAVLDNLDGDLLTVSKLDEAAALSALEDDTVEGIFYIDDTLSLTVKESNLRTTVLSSVLSTYLKNAEMFKAIAAEHPEKLEAAIDSFSSDRTFIEDVSIGGQSYDVTLEYFFALVAMACSFGAFNGMSLAMESVANVSPLGARRSASPERKSTAILIDLLAAMTIQLFSNLILLLYLNFVLGISLGGNFAGMMLICALGSLVGVSFGMVVGALGKISLGVKVSLVVGIPLFTGFLAGLMYGSMKYLIERSVPIINRLNPSALISDALYFLNVYNDTGALYVRLGNLALIAVGLTLLAVLMLRRIRHDSI